jgi:hypothetical protein
MRNSLVFVPVLLGACATAAAPGPTQSPADLPVHGQTPGQVCTTEGTGQFIGKTRSDETADAIKRTSHAKIVRWAPPGVAMTMDFRSDRVTVYLDDSNRITKIKCG